MTVFRRLKSKHFFIGVAVACFVGFGWLIVYRSPALSDAVGKSQPTGEIHKRQVMALPASASNAESTTFSFRDEPASHALYSQMIDAMRKANSLSYVSHYKFDAKDFKGDCTYRAWLKKPNFFRVETESSSGQTVGILVGDGKMLWIHWPNGRPRFELIKESNSEANQKTRTASYMKMVAPPNGHSIGHEMMWLGAGMVMPIIDPSTCFGYTDSLQPYVDGVRGLGTEKVGDEECDKIEVSLMEGQRIWCLWLSKSDHLPRRLNEIMRLDGDVSVNEEWSSVTVNTDMPMTIFAWKPSADWSEWKIPSPEDWLLKPGTKAPDFDLASIDGKRIRLSDYRGQIVWLCIWRVGCPPCRREIPCLQNVYVRYKDKGLVVLGLNISDDRDITLKVLHENGVTFPNILDTSETAVRVVNQDYGSDGAVPKHYLIDRNGTIVDRWFGYGGLSGEFDPRANAALQKIGGELGEDMRREAIAKAKKASAAVVVAAQRLFQALRSTDYNHDWLNTDDWRYFPAKDVSYGVDHSYAGWVAWVCEKFKNNPIVDVRLGDVFANGDGLPTIHFELHLKNREVLQGDLPFRWNPEDKVWFGWKGLDWHLRDAP